MHGRQIYDKFDSSRIGQRCFQLLDDLFKDDVTLSLLERVSNNLRLFSLFGNLPCDKYKDIKSALKALRNDQEAKNKILIQFTELNLYGIFTPESYTTFTQNVFSSWEDRPEEVRFHPKQIILTGLPQKLLFVCFGDENIVEKIRLYVKQKYNCDITSTKTDVRTEITVHGVGGNSYEESQQIYSDLFQYINGTKKDEIVAQKMMPMPVEKMGKHNYVRADLSYKIDQPMDLANILSMVKTVHGGNVVINLTIVNGGNNVINYNVVNDDAHDSTTKWILENPPKNREVTTDYYNRYVAGFNGKKVAVNVYGKLVRDCGYKIIKSSTCRLWIKK